MNPAPPVTKIRFPCSDTASECSGRTNLSLS
jgi:hypothetical protein